MQDNAIHTSEPIVASVYSQGDQAVIYNGKELLLWNFKTGLAGSAFSDSVPSQENMIGLALYPTNKRVYLIDRAQDRVVSFLPGASAIEKPVVSVQNVGDLSRASGLAIDGNIYIAVNGSINKYNSGKAVDFRPSIPSSLSDTAQLYTETSFKYLYVLDSGNKRIIILNKDGSLVATLASNELSNMKDFTVDEKAKAIYVLKDSSLIKVAF